ncbi:MAG: hypothetical protein U0800_19140 [Isosphaeraceae bacterium]
MLGKARGGWTAAGILVLVLATAAVAGWAVSWWIVPPYVALMAWLLLPADERDKSAGSATVPPAPTIEVGPTSAAVPAPIDEPSPVAATPTRPAKARKPRARSKAKDKEPTPSVVVPVSVNWVQVAPGKFIRVESPTAPPVEEANPAEIDGGSPPSPIGGQDRPPDPPPDDGLDPGEAGFDPPMRPDDENEAGIEVRGKITLIYEAPDRDDPGPGDDPGPDDGPEVESPERHPDEHLGYAEVREPGGEEAATTPTEPVGACEAGPGPDAEAPPEGPPACPTDDEPGVAGIAPDASGTSAGRAPGRAAAAPLMPSRVDGWPGRLLDDRAGRTHNPIAGIPTLPTPRLNGAGPRFG